MRRLTLFVIAIILCGNSLNVPARNERVGILADVELLRSLNISVIESDEVTGVGFAEVNPLQQFKISQKAHKSGRCGGFEVIGNNVANPKLELYQLRSATLSAYGQPLKSAEIGYRQEIADAIKQVSEASIEETVGFLSKFHNRYYASETKNDAIFEFKKRIEGLPNASKLQVDLINHNRISQKSIRVRLVGSTYPNEIVVIGGHIDSVNQRSFGMGPAPGYDDNASGSADIFEVLKIMLTMPTPQRTVEFFWYAGEEGGLLGSSEIAQSYKQSKSDVVGVMQLDMTSYVGSGNNTAAIMTDFTNPNLNNYLRELNSTYVNGNIIEDKCGYGCSDHASWFRQGYATVMPFESTFSGMNPNIHTANDVKVDKTNFYHAALFAKFALSFASDLANSRYRP